jgi:hypothetical protein
MTRREEIYAGIVAEMKAKFPDKALEKNGRWRDAVQRCAHALTQDWKRARMTSFRRYRDVMRLLQRYPNLTVDLSALAKDEQELSA